MVLGRWITQMWSCESTAMPGIWPVIHLLGRGLGQVRSRSNLGTLSAAGCAWAGRFRISQAKISTKMNRDEAAMRNLFVFMGHPLSMTSDRGRAGYLPLIPRWGKHVVAGPSAEGESERF